MNKLIAGFCSGGTGTLQPFNQVFSEGRCIAERDYREQIKDLDALIIWGGADISPSIYDEHVSSYSGARSELSNRDKYEIAACQMAIQLGVPILGICRGAQLACALAGGKLVQHVDNHGRTHTMTTNKGDVILTSSVHHQMMYPWDVNHELLAWSTQNRANVYLGADDALFKDADKRVEPEIVYFPSIKALAIQGHPEFMSPNCEFVQHCMDLTRQYILTGIDSPVKEAA